MGRKRLNRPKEELKKEQKRNNKRCIKNARIFRKVLKDKYPNIYLNIKKEYIDKK